MGTNPWGSQLRRRAKRARKSHRVVSIALYLALGLAAAFVVSALARSWTGDADEAGVADPEPDEGARIRVEVLNGSGARGLARNATRQLRSAGFDVVFFGNADRFDHTTSVALDRTGDIEGARAVAIALGIDSVVTAFDSTLLLEVTVILGGDWPPPSLAPPEDWLDRIRERVGTDSAGDPISNP